MSQLSDVFPQLASPYFGLGRLAGGLVPGWGYVVAVGTAGAVEAVSARAAVARAKAFNRSSSTTHLFFLPKIK